MEDGNFLTPYPSQPRFQFLQCVHIFRRIHGVALFQKFCVNHTLTVPKDREKHLPCERKHFEFFRRWSRFVSILLRLLLRFRIIMMNPGFIPSDNLTEEVFTILIKFSQQFSTDLHSLQLYLRRQHSWDPSSRNFPVS